MNSPSGGERCPVCAGHPLVFPHPGSNQGEEDIGVRPLYCAAGWARFIVPTSPRHNGTCQTPSGVNTGGTDHSPVLGWEEINPKKAAWGDQKLKRPILIPWIWKKSFSGDAASRIIWRVPRSDVHKVVRSWTQYPFLDKAKLNFG